MRTPLVAPIPFRLRLGVVGPRTLPHPDKTRVAVRQILTGTLPEIFPAMKKRDKDLPIAFSVISMLAEGADQLVMEEVKAWQPEAWQEALLPFSLEQYEMEYAEGAARDKFHALRKSCQRVFGMQEDLEILEGRPEMDAAFGEAVQELVESCDILIAVENPSAPSSFTAQAIQYAKELNRPTLIINALDPDQQIRRSTQGKVKFPASKDLRQLNRKLRQTKWIPEQAKAEEANFLAGNLKPLVDQLRTDRVELVKKVLLPYFVFWDKLAVEKRNSYSRSGHIVYLLSPIAVALMAASLMLENFKPLLMPVILGFTLVLSPAEAGTVTSLLIDKLGPVLALLQLIIIGITLLLMHLASGREGRERWIESRFVAERCRSAIYLALAGMKLTSLRIPAHLTSAHPPNEWPVRVSHEIEFQMSQVSSLQEDEVASVAAYEKLAWVNGQRGHHERKAGQMRDQYRMLTIFGNVSLFIGLILGGIEVADGIQGNWGQVLNWMGAVVPAIGAAMTAMRQHGELLRIEARSYRLSLEFERLEQKVARVRHKVTLERELRVMEELTLDEVQDWYLLMRLANQFEAPS